VYTLISDKRMKPKRGRTWIFVVSSADLNKVYHVPTSNIHDMSNCPVFHFLFSLWVLNRTCTNIVGRAKFDPQDKGPR